MMMMMRHLQPGSTIGTADDERETFPEIIIIDEGGGGGLGPVLMMIRLSRRSNP